MKSESIEQLKNIKSKLGNQRMSVLIGAGFSKNVSDTYPSWWQLLYDLVLEMYRSEFEELYEQLNQHKSKIEKNKFYDNKIQTVIQKKGYLQIVSDFINRRGYREAIETYIEERTPLLTPKLKLITNRGDVTCEEEIKEEDLNLHRRLIQLPWNNIYTTNYDNLLEFVAATDTEKYIKNLMGQITHEIESLTKDKEKKKEELSQIEDASSSIQQKSLPKGDSSQPLSTVKEKTPTINPKIWELKGEINYIDRLVKLNDENFKLLEKGLNHCLNLVIYSSDLTVKRNKNIIKLHGTLRSPEEKQRGTFGFDGDTHKHYIISKEDFDTYPIKHEAFTQLMRISLLQESYCLIGFSAEDPNFLAWISWVRDVIEKSSNSRLKRQYKIYLIDFETKSTPNDRRLFYENHGIFRISLNDPAVISFLEKENDSKIDNPLDKKELLENLLSYLTNEESINLSKSALELVNIKRYNNCWDRITYSYQDEINDELLKKLVANLDELKLLRQGIIIPPLDAPNDMNKRHLLFFSIKLLTANIDIKSGFYSKQLIELFIVALKDSYIPIHSEWGNKEMKLVNSFIAPGEPIHSQLLLLSLRHHNLSNNRISFNTIFKKLQTGLNEDFKNELEFEKLLHLAFNLDFAELNLRLSKWKPSKLGVTKKAALLSLFNEEEAEKLLSTHKFAVEAETNQEQLNTLDLYNYIIQNKNFTSPKELEKRIKTLKDSGSVSVSKHFNDFVEQLTKSKNKIKPYGDKKFSVSKTIHFSRESQELTSIQFLQLLMETGIQLSLTHVYYVSSDKWYHVLKNLYDKCPFPCLFYSLQYSEEDFLKRVGQDYAYSPNLVKEIKWITTIILKNYLNDTTPLRIKQNSLIFVSELFNALSPEEWEGNFYLVWKELIKQNKAFGDKHRVKGYTFCVKALLGLKKQTILQNVISDILLNFEGNEDICVDYLYRIALNPHLPKVKIKSGSALYNKLDEIIGRMPSLKEDVLFVLGNLHEILPKKLRGEAVKQIKKLDFTQYTAPNIWKVLLFFSESDKLIIQRVKLAIINNKFLWHTGISSSGISMSRGENITLHRLEKTKNKDWGIVWSRKEVYVIYRKLIQELNEIEKALKKREDLTLFAGVLEEMVYFLQKHADKLKNDTKFNKTFQKCKNLYFSQKEYSELFEGLSSDDSEKVVWALAELNKSLYFDSFDKNEKHLNLLLNKMLLKVPAGLEATFSYVSFWFYDLKNKDILKKYSGTIEEVLKKYSEQDLREFEIPTIEEHLIKLALVLNNWRVKSEIVNYWLKRKTETRFNNIKYMNLR